MNHRSKSQTILTHETGGVLLHIKKQKYIENSQHFTRTNHIQSKTIQKYLLTQGFAHYLCISGKPQKNKKLKNT